MRPGRVIGKVTLSHAARQFTGARWLIVGPMGPDELSGKNPAGVADGWAPVVYDNLGAGLGDEILFVEGTEATQPFDYPIPLDAINVALIDTFKFKTPDV